MSAAPPQPAEPCAFYDMVCKSQQTAGKVIGEGAANAIQALSDAVYEAVGKMLATVGTAWTGIKTPPLTGTGGGAQTIAFLQGSLWFYTAGLAVLAVLIGGARMAWEQRADPGFKLLKSLWTLAVVGACAVAGVALLIGAADLFSTWIIDRSTDGPGFAQNLTALFTAALSAGSGGAGVGAFLTIVLGGLAILGSIVQAMLMIARSGMVVMLAGTLPTAAAFTSTDAGEAMFRKAVAWTLAFILYKPAAAIVYATAFRLTASDLVPDDGTGALSFLVGLVMMVLALIALPALMRLITPAVAAVATGGGAGGGAALGGALASGAISLGGAVARRGKGSAAGPSGSDEGASGPKGAGPSGSPKPGGGPTGSSAPGGAASALGAAGGPTGVMVGTAISAGKAGVDTAKRGAQRAAGSEEGPDGSS